MGLGVPLICSDIKENVFLIMEDGITFKKSSVDDLTQKLIFALENPLKIKALAIKAQKRIIKDYSWDNVTEQHIKLFLN